MAPPAALGQLERKPSLGDGLELRAMRKTASCEPICKGALASPTKTPGRIYDDYETASDTPLRVLRTWTQHDKSLSDNGTPTSIRSNNFLVGSTEDDDVFTDGSVDEFGSRLSPRQEARVPVHHDLRDKPDPQTMYAGSSCMFVANLPQQYHDHKLEEEVTKAFSQFGIVFVKIKRDSRGMPFAFCQYTNDEDAKNAMKVGKGIMILDRPCRTEMARAHSSFIVYKPSGQRIRLHEARDLLRRLGQVSKTEYLSEGLRAVARLPQTVIVTYKMYDPRRDPPKFFQNDQTYCVEVYDPKTLGSQESAPIVNPREGSFLKQYDKDRRSAYVGNLPPSMTKDVLKSLASSCGEVLEVQVHHKEVLNGNGAKTCFGFLEFSRPDAPDEFVEVMHNAEIDGHRIRAERKQSRSSEVARYFGSGVSDATHPRYVVGRARVNSFELEKPLSGRPDISPEVIDSQTCGKLYSSNSYTPGRTRAARPTVLDRELSSAHGVCEPPAGATAHSSLSLSGRDCRNTPSKVHGPAAKKSVEFKLPNPGTDVATTPLRANPEAIDAASKFATPIQSSTISNYAPTEQAASQGEETPSGSVAGMPWIPPYSPFGYPYLGAAITPQANHGLMYPGYMQHPMSLYHGMYDMYGNMLYSPTHLVPTFSPTSISQETSVRSEAAQDIASVSGSDAFNEREGEEQNVGGHF
ncbi:hypothetical protein HIM_01468 [Hirsutella minnesotensis 3608]|nr:hypothetical protein HIM_01468 [Hirsutella minnesotensis 3608]